MSLLARFLVASSVSGGQDTTPNAFSFTNVTTSSAGVITTSETITVTGMSAGSSVSVSCTSGQIDAGTSSLSGTWETSKTVTASGSGTIQLRARITSGDYIDSVNQAITVNGVSTTWTVTTSDADLVPSSFSGFYILGLTPSATAQDLGLGTVTGLSPNADYYLEEYGIPDENMEYFVGTSSTSSVTSFTNFPANRTTNFSVPFTTDSLGTAYFKVKPVLEYNWTESEVRLVIKSSYSGSTSATWRNCIARTEPQFSVSPSLSSPQVVASAGIQVEWEVVFTNLPTTRGPLTIQLDSDVIGIGDGFDGADGYSLTQGGSYSHRLTVSNHTSSTLTFYVGLTSELQVSGSQLHTVPAYMDVTDNYGNSVRLELDFEVEF